MYKMKSVRTKILLGFTLIFLLVVTMVVLLFNSFKQIDTHTNEMIEKEVPLLIVDENMTKKMAEQVAMIRGYILLGRPQLKDELLETMEERQAITTELLKLSDSEKIDETLELMDKWEGLLLEAVKEKEAGNDTIALDLIQEANIHTNDIYDVFNGLANESELLITEAGEELSEVSKRSIVLILVIASIVIVVGIGIAIVTSNSITRPVNIVKERMVAIADGDLSQAPLEIKSNDEIGQLMNAINIMSNNSRTIMQNVQEVSDIVTGQSEELSQAANEVGSGMEQVASTMEELASATEIQAHSTTELTNSMSLFTEKVSGANENSEQITEKSTIVIGMTDEGTKMMAKSTNQMDRINEVVQDSVEKMKGLDQQAQEISKLVGVINDIADQTNLLALNAAIEAARAGENGRGFAVVADEVRKLAEQVAYSVNDITTFVDNIQAESNVVSASLESGFTAVVEGTTQMEATGRTFQQIYEEVNEMALNIDTVSTNLQDIVENNEQMSKAIEEIASVSEEAAAGVQETAASAEQSSSSMQEVSGSSVQLTELAEQLNDLVRQFKL